MGADLIYALCRYPKVALERIAHLRDEVLLAVGDRVMSCSDKREDLERVRAFLAEAVAVAMSTRRDIVTFTLSEGTYVLTAGMSWGDDPTDAFRYIDALAESGVLEP